MSFPSYRIKRLQKMIKIMRSDGIRKKVSINSGAVWFDDWFTIEEIAHRTFKISEPRFYLQNNSYLLLGESDALLFDTGSGKRDISPLVFSLTDMPLMVLPSHAHSDHLGSIHKFEQIILADLLINRKNTRGNIFKPSYIMYCDFPRRPQIPISKWIDPQKTIDLGNRSLRIIPVPGHSLDSIALLDEQNKMIFTGDFLYKGNLIASLGGSVASYLSSTQKLIAATKGDELLFPAHYTTGLKWENLADLQEALRGIIAGQIKGRPYTFSRKYPINDKMSFITTKRKIKLAREGGLSNEDYAG